MSEPVIEVLATPQPVVEVLDTGPVLELVLPYTQVVEVVAPGPQGPANTDYQIGGTEPTDLAVKIWYKLT